MSDRRSAFDLEEALRDVGARLDYPPSADLRPAVLSRIREGGARTGLLGLFRSPLSLAPAFATLVLLLAATFAFQPVAGQAAEALGLRGIGLFRVPATPQPTASGPLWPADARPAPSVAEASRAVGFDVRVPTAIEEPPLIYVRESDDASLVLLYWGHPELTGRASVLVTELRGSVEAQILGKSLPPGTRIEEVEVKGARGVWIDGEPHQFFYRAPNGDILIETVRLAGNVLLWEQDGLLMRIEAQIDRDQALLIARSMR